MAVTGTAATIMSVVGALAGAAASVYGTISSNRQAEKSAARQAEYQRQLAAEQAATQAEERRLAQEAQDRTRNYGASLLDSNTLFGNMLSGGYTDESLGSTIINSSTLGSGTTGVESMFA